jgi:hypothetical protein
MKPYRFIVEVTPTLVYGQKPVSKIQVKDAIKYMVQERFGNARVKPMPREKKS